MIYVYEPLLQSNFSVGLILGALFFGLGYLAGCGLLDSFTEKWREIFISNMEQRAPGSFGYAIGAFFAGIFFIDQSPYQLLVKSRYLALYL
ncbi:MFS transporter [Escherichia coli]